MMNNLSQGLGSFNNMMPQNNMGQQNPYGQQMNPQMMGQQMTSPEMFSEQLMAPNQMAPMQDPMQGLQPMSQPEGFGVYGQSLEGFADGGEAVPRETEIMGQPHMLAYINPEEEMMLRQMGGSGMAGPGGVPSYPPTRQSGAGANVTGSSNSGTRGSANNDAKERRQEAARQAANLANLQAQAAAAEKMMADQAAQQLAAETLAAKQAVDLEGYGSPLPANNVTASSNGTITYEDVAALDAQRVLDAQKAGDTALKTSLVPKSRPADLTDNSKTSGIMSVVNDVRDGFKNLISDVGMTYAGGIGSFKDLSNTDNYESQYKKLVDLDYDPAEVTRYLDTTKATQATIREDYLGNNEILEGSQRRRDMRDERLADEARLASTAVGTGIETLPTGSPTGAGTVGTTYVNDPQTIVQPQSSVQGDFRKDYSYLNNDNFFANDLTTDGNSIGFSYGNNGVGGGTVTVNLNGGYDVISMDNSTQTNYSTLDEAMNAVQGISAAPPVVAPPVVAPPVVAPPAVAPTSVPPAATVDPMTPVGGDFLLPGQQNYGPTPAAALNFDPNTYMQTPQNASVALPSMFQQSNPYTFEELLSMYKPAYEPIL